VIPLSTQHYPMLRRDLIYTASGASGTAKSLDDCGQGFACRAPVVKTG
jgi:hypothetical protein